MPRILGNPDTTLADLLDDHSLLDLFPKGHPDHAVMFRDVAAVKKQVTASGSHYFSADAMRFFNARMDGLVGGRFLIDSVKDGDNPRQYRVGWFTPTEAPEGLRHSRTRHFDTLKEARDAATWLANHTGNGEPIKL